MRILFNHKHKFLFLFIVLLLTLPSSSAEAASISFKNSQIEITSPSSNNLAFQDEVQIEGTSCLETVWLCIRGPQNEIASYPAEVINNKFSYTMHLRFGPGKYTVWAGNNRTRFDGSIRFELENTQTKDIRYLSPSAYIDSDNEAIIELAVSLVNENMTDYEKVSVIHDWVAQNIRYDVAAYSNKDNNLKKASEVLETGTGMCRDYSFLVAALARRAGLPAKVVYGVASDGSNPSRPHAWNEVFVDNEWINIDATWDAGYVQNGNFVFSFTDKYFNVDKKTFALSHLQNTIALH